MKARAARFTLKVWCHLAVPTSLVAHFTASSWWATNLLCVLPGVCQVFGWSSVCLCVAHWYVHIPPHPSFQSLFHVVTCMSNNHWFHASVDYRQTRAWLVGIGHVNSKQPCDWLVRTTWSHLLRSDWFVSWSCVRVAQYLFCEFVWRCGYYHV